MRGCLRLIMIVLSLGLAVLIGWMLYNIVMTNPAPSPEDMVEILTYGLCFIVCINITIQLFKWGKK